jgi:hypothetical protein
MSRRLRENLVRVLINPRQNRGYCTNLEQLNSQPIPLDCS